MNNRTSCQTLERLNEKFNKELKDQINTLLPSGHIYEFGHPFEILKSSGFPDLPIQMSASRLTHKSNQENHPFDLAEIMNLPLAIQTPLAVFRSATKIGSNVILTELEQNGKNFVAAVETRKKVGKIEINSIRSIHPRTNSNIINWINEGLLEYADKIRMSVWLEEKKKSRNTFGSTPANAVKQLLSAAKIVIEFNNPTIKP